MSEKEKPPANSAEALALASGLDGTLNERLTAYLEHSKRLRPDFVGAYERLIGRLDALESGKVGPQVGEPMPDFLLPDQNGQLVSLEDLLRAGPVVVSINRGHWCPYCKLDLRALAQVEPDIRKLGAQLVSIMPEMAQFTKKSIADNAFPFPILTDVDLSYALSLGLIYWVGTEIVEMYAGLGFQLEQFQGNANNFLPTAAKFVIGADGLIKAREVNVDFRQRMEPQAVLDALAKLKS